MGRLFLLRGLLRGVVLLGRELSRGNPYAWGVVALGGVAALASALRWFIRRPLGGDPDRSPSDEDAFRDASNPYRPGA